LKSSTLTGTPRAAPQTYINELSEAVAVDPGQILRIDTTTAPGKKQLADVLMRIMPIRFEVDEIATALAAGYRPIENPQTRRSRARTSTDCRGARFGCIKKYAYQVTEQRRG